MDDNIYMRETNNNKGEKMQDIIQIHNIDETIAMLWEMIDGKCCHRDFINEVMTAINSLKKIRQSC